MKYYYTLHQILTRIPLHAAPSAEPCGEIAICDRRPAPVNNDTPQLSISSTAKLRKLRFEIVAKYKIVTAPMSPYNQIRIRLVMCDEVEMIKVINMIAIRPEILVLHKIHCSCSF